MPSMRPLTGIEPTRDAVTVLLDGKSELYFRLEPATPGAGVLSVQNTSIAIQRALSATDGNAKARRI